jgi:SAM-dependent methyltransferase
MKRLFDMGIRTLVWALWQSNIWGGLLAGRLVYWTGKSSRAVHPKHFLAAAWRAWYLPSLRAGDVALDVGCNNAMHTMAAAPHVQAIYGFDYSRTHLATAQALVAQKGLTNVYLSAGSAVEGWHYADASFDVVLFQDVLEHIRERDFALQELHRVLKPGGRLLVAVPKRDTSWKRLRSRFGVFAFSDPDHKVEYTEAELRNELARNGFAVESVDVIVYDTPWAGFIDLVGGLSLGLYRALAQWKRDAALRHPEESTGFRVVARRV